MICALLACATPGIAIADANETRDEVAARVLFTEGRKLVASGDYPAACPKFEESFRVDPGMGTSFNLADCWQHIGRTASAWARFLDVAASAHAAGQIERERLARQRAAALEPQLSRLVLDVNGVDADEDDRPSVRRDGLAIRDAAWGVPFPVDPGIHVVEASAPGKKTWARSVPVTGDGQMISVLIPVLEDQPPPPSPSPSPSLSLPVQDPPAAPGPAPAVDLTAPNPAAARSAVPLIGLGALAALGFAAGTTFALDFHWANAAAKTLCTVNNACASLEEKQHHDELVREARRDRYLAAAGAGIGVAAAVTAAAVWWRPLSAKPAVANQLALRPIGLSGAALRVDW
jgi:hypothetical protein